MDFFTSGYFITTIGVGIVIYYGMINDANIYHGLLLMSIAPILDVIMFKVAAWGTPAPVPGLTTLNNLKNTHRSLEIKVAESFIQAYEKFIATGIPLPKTYHNSYTLNANLTTPIFKQLDEINFYNNAIDNLENKLRLFTEYINDKHNS
jgi:hypothetical protein